MRRSGGAALDMLIQHDDAFATFGWRLLLLLLLVLCCNMVCTQHICIFVAYVMMHFNSLIHKYHLDETKMYTHTNGEHFCNV